MRAVALGHWHYFTWHFPALALMLAAAACAVSVARTLRRNVYGHRERSFRWRIIGWSSLVATILSAVVWPYLVAAANVTVDTNGTWHLTNYLGIPVANIPPDETRELRGVDLGGLGVGLGRLEIRLGSGEVIQSVRVSRDSLNELRRALGYPDSMVHNSRADQVIGPHRYSAHGPTP